MLVLPIVNKRRVMNVEIRLKNASKIRKNVSFDDAKEGDIIVNREKFSESSFHHSKDINAPIDFIRSRSILYPRNFLITTQLKTDSNCYDVYEVPQPPKKVNSNLDKLYSKTITDMQKEIPGSPSRGRYVSFEDLGIDHHLSNSKIALLQRIVKEDRNPEMISRKLQEAGISDLEDTIHFLENFDCTVISDSVIPEDSLQDTLRALGSINSRDYRNLKKYYHMAKANTDIYTKISYIHKMIYDKPLTLLKTDSFKQKQLIKKKEESDFSNVA